jgi:hypothetical protein
MPKATFLFREGRLYKSHIAPHYFGVQASFLLKGGLWPGRFTSGGQAKVEWSDQS